MQQFPTQNYTFVWGVSKKNRIYYKDSGMSARDNNNMRDSEQPETVTRLCLLCRLVLSGGIFEESDK